MCFFTVLLNKLALKFGLLRELATYEIIKSTNITFIINITSVIIIIITQ